MTDLDLNSFPLSFFLTIIIGGGILLAVLYHMAYRGYSDRQNAFKSALRGNWFRSNEHKLLFQKIVSSCEVVDGGDLLRALCNGVVTDLGNDVKALDIQSQLSRPFECSIGTHTLFERWWYEDLLKAIHDCVMDNVILIGSSGTSKSTWQFWYLYRVLQAIHKSKFQISIEYCYYNERVL